MDLPSYEQLLHENQRLRDLVVRLQARIDELERTAKRQAAPFSKGPPKPQPKKPGRKAGEQHGKHGHRPPPPPASVTEQLDAPLPEQCPACGGHVVEDHLDQQYQTEIPRQPLVRAFTIHCGHCDRCGKKLRGRHPLQTSDATGAAQSQLGPDAQAAIVYLNKRAGLSHGKIADAFDKFFGISLARGACAQVVGRAGQILQPVYDQIKERLKGCQHITPDETGWRIGGHAVWLHAWVGDDGATLYAIDPQRSADVLEKVIGPDWSGNMTHDGFSSYDRFEEALHQQCNDHALRRARKLLEKQSGVASHFAQQVIDLFTDGLRQRDHLNETAADIEQRCDSYDHYTARLLQLTERPRCNAANERFAKHLYKYGEAWFVHLLDADIPATNHRAEQALRTPIVNRKVWGGNRTEAGGVAQAVISSVLHTCANKATNAFTFVSNAFRGIFTPLFK